MSNLSNPSKPEILSPAGNMERLKYAYAFGADAVYVGGRDFSLRAKASNFSLEGIDEAVRYAHDLGKKLYVTLNIFGRNSDFNSLKQYVASLSEIGVDAVIVADPGILSVVKSIAPKMRIHISTQANVTNTFSANFWYEQGASRVVLARELPAREIREISQNSRIETEAFIHGAMCMAYSGRCFMSKFMADRDGNRGDCAHSCRWKYHLIEEERPGEYHEIDEDDRGTYIFNSKDLMLINHIPELMSCELKSLKIEGRMKSTHYVAAITKIYRQAIDTYFEDPGNYRLDPEWLEEAKKVSHRDYSTGFFLGEKGEEVVEYSRYRKGYDFVGVVAGYDRENGLVEVEVRNRMRLTDEIEILSPSDCVKGFRIPAMIRLSGAGYGEHLEAAHAGYRVGIPSERPWPEFSIIRRPVDKTVID